MNGAELFVRLMEAAGIDHSFGVLAGSALEIGQHIYRRSSGRYIPVRHEQVAASAADGFGRISGRPAICFGAVTAGATNLLTGVAIAHRDSAPLIAVTANDPFPRLHRDIWQGMDVVPLFAPVTKYSRQIRRAAEIPYHFRNAVIRATSGRPGPVHLDMPFDVATEPVDEATEREAEQVMRQFDRQPACVPADRPPPSRGAIDAAVALLRTAERPTIAVGGGVIWSEASDDLVRLAERLCAPVLVTHSARGAIPEDHPLCVGPAGMQGSPVAERALADADVVLAVGARLSDSQTRGWTLISPAAVIIQNNIEPEEIGRNYPVNVRLPGDARLTLEALNAALDARGFAAGAGAVERAKRYRRLRDAEWADFVASNDSGLVKPQAAVRELRRILPRDAILAHGAGLYTFFANRTPVYAPRCHIKAIDAAAMCFAFPASLGAQLAAPDRDVVVLTGDGDFMMTNQDLETAVRERLPVLVVIFNNFRLGAEQLANGRIDESICGVTHGNPDFAAFAELFGAFGKRVSSLGELAPAIEQARQAKRERGVPALIDVHIDPLEVPRWLRAPYQEPALTGG